MRGREFVAVAVLLVSCAAPALAQQNRPQQQTATKASPAAEEPELKYEREYFLYPVSSRRDPFVPLVGVGEGGPRFEELSLRGIIYSRERGRSVALLAGPNGKIYRVREGDEVGNARVLGIQPLQVLFAVDNFGVVRQERLELKRKENEGDAG